ncbi:ubiquinone biosynthesis monooxygenase Coq6p, mitochondrial [[Candida] railenensis]|uniref:Ubiquinone biosynthesis monooxygenase COQ6, mitochondrial n=1 Tax=[Candida] railenensis TaxID=45579 RepID=A0A9P0QMN7_9ASCO|nr:ubiquinone biosynthesis monooxygenase Coq6p, mitochondrial [[Candida] railenensis]
MLFKRLLATAAKSVQGPVLQDVVIIGGGPAGLSLLAALKSSSITRNLKCTLVEGSSLEGIREFADSPPEEYTNRVVSLTPKSVEFMQSKIGNWEFMNQDRIKFYNNIIAYDSQDRTSRIVFDGSAIEAGFLAVMAENVNIQSSLLQRISQLKEEGVDSTILDNTKVLSIGSALKEAEAASESTNIMSENVATASDWPIVNLSDGSSIQTRLLVGADGFNSPVRKYAGIQSRGWAYDRFGVVATVKLQYEDYRSIGWQRFLTTGPLAILPLTEDNATIVWSSTPELSEILIACDEQIFPELVNAAMTLDEVSLNFIYAKLKKNPNDFSVLDDIPWRQSRLKVNDLEENYPLPVTEVVPGSRARFPLKLSHADTYTSARIALVGDAAHTVHPLAGQGLNMGQGDVQALVEAIEKGVTRGMDIGSTLVLEPYTSNQWPGNHVLMGVCDKLHKIFSTDWYPIVFLRGFGMKNLNMLDFVKDMMIKNISGR